MPVYEKSKIGLIARESFETYPNGWTFDPGSSNATARMITKTHSGSGALQIETGKNWPAYALAKLTKDFDLKTGGGFARIFRGPMALTYQNYPSAVFDDFPDSTLDGDKWPNGTFTLETDVNKQTNNNPQDHTYLIAQKFTTGAIKTKLNSIYVYAVADGNMGTALYSHDAGNDRPLSALTTKQTVTVSGSPKWVKLT
jgi:hypothetical protein